MFPEFSVNKIVPLRFAGIELKFKTTHALFSSHRVDEGTMLLLKTLVQRSSVPENGRVLDAGCGFGPLAVAIKKYRPTLEVSARDRLVLAATYTSENARLNGTEVEAAPGLLLDISGPWNLIVSNLPAKAGPPVLQDFVERSLGMLASDGLVAVVVVEPLAEWLAGVIESLAKVEYREKAPGYEVFHYRQRALSPSLTTKPFPSAYVRGEVPWKVGKRKFIQKTFYGLPNFDGLDFRLQTTIGLLEGLKPGGDCLVWEPVQGHLATWASAVMPQQSTLHVAGNDLLGLRAATENCLPREIAVHRTFLIADVLDVHVDLALIQLHPEPEVPWTEATAEALKRIVVVGGHILLNGRSTDIGRLLERQNGLRILRDQRAKGWRATLLVRTK